MVARRPAARARGGGAHRAQPLGVQRDRVDLPRSRSGVSSSSRITIAAPRLLHPARVRGLVVRRGVRIRDSTAGRPYCGELEHASRRRARRRGRRREGGPERLEVVAQDVVVVGGVQRRAKSRWPATCRTRYGAPAKRVDRLVDRARAERAAEHQHDVSSGPMPSSARAPARSVTVGGTGRPVTQVAVAVAPFEREGEADAVRAAGQRAVGQAEVRVRLGEHERDPLERRREADGAGDVPAAAQDRVGPRRAEDAAGGAERGDRAGRRPRRP